MREIIIKSMRFKNFKGLRDLTITFPGKDIDISAENGLGKSSIFDGFTWVLFGKNRRDQKQFSIKTYDENNVVIPRIDHEVEITLSVDGEEVTLCRRYLEKWTKKKGQAEEEFSGHITERLYNNVPCNDDEFAEKIAELCPEHIFKFITNPLYFTAQKWEAQREMLIRMAGGITDAEVATGNPDFTKLLADITGKTMADYKKEVQAKKNAIKKTIKDKPGEIRGKRSSIPTPEDWQALEAQRTTLNNERTALEKQLADLKAASDTIANQHTAITDEIFSLRKKIADRKFAIEQGATKEYRELIAQRSEILSNHASFVRRLRSLEADRETWLKKADNCGSTREQLLAEYKYLIAEATAITREINTGSPQMSDNDFTCPTCGRSYDIDRIEEIQAKLWEQFRAKLNAQLNDNANKIEANKKRGKENNDIKTGYLETVSVIDKEIAEVKGCIAEIENMPLYDSEPVKPDTTPLVENDGEIKALRAQIEALEAKRSELTQQGGTADNSDIINRLSEISHETQAIAVRLSKREDIERLTREAENLEAELRTANNELAELEGIEFTMQQFAKARIESVEKKINSLFTLVRFKMYNEQINGGEAETCEAIVDGVPYSDLNDAGRINAGLDIINAICHFEGYFAPIFIDNAEGVNHPLQTKSQRIRLIVSHDPKIIVKPTENTPTLF